ncbi:chitin synthase-domain-containing protein [Schizothecium vesticola]|uniref:Chitin synthase n=1 Tax=Schizothecium vesticola TaxID=314040 RepID=A0AA40EL34_9PEZI|nr:chitin synthase-domain-containing protein [Schizothecium vesticola]
MSYPEASGSPPSYLDSSESTDIIPPSPDSPHLPRSPYASDSRSRTGASSESLPRYSQLRCRFSAKYPMPLHIRTTVWAKYINRDGKRSDFDYLRYTAINGDLDDFLPENGYSLRPALFGHGTEALVCVPFAGENVEMFARTLHSVMESVRELSFLGPSSFWNVGAPAWQKVVVCVVVDSTHAFDERILGLFVALGVYQDGIMAQDKGAVEKPNGNSVAAHVFECTSPMPVMVDGEPVQPATTNLATLAPVQLMLCLKAHKTERTTSHRWAYGAFARILEPNIIIHVDTGTYLHRNAIFQLWKEFHQDPLLGGAAGTLSPDLGKYCRALVNPLVAAQNFECKAVSQLEALMESTTGYMSVFTGSFFAYRYVPYCMELLSDRHRLSAMTGTNGQGRRQHSRSDEFKRQLDDDRLLPREIVLQEGHKWRTRLVLSARANSDVPTSAASLVEQHCRHLRQSSAASFDLFRKTASLRRTDHSILRQCAIFVQMAHNLHAWLLLWFSLSGCLLTTFLINDAAGSPPSTGFPFGSSTPTVNAAIQIGYICFLLLQFLLALSHRPQRFAGLYTLSMTVFSLVQLYTLVSLLYLTKHLVDYRNADHVVPLKLTKHPGGFHPDLPGAGKYEFINRYYTDIGPATVIPTLIAILDVYPATALPNLDSLHLITSWAQYLILWSAKVNVLNTSAICNLYRGPNHQWQSSTPEEALEHGQAETKTAHAGRPRLKAALVVAAYVLCNLAVCLATFISVGGGGAYWRRIWFLRLWMWANASLVLVRGAAMVWFTGGRMVGFWVEPRVV